MKLLTFYCTFFIKMTSYGLTKYNEKNSKLHKTTFTLTIHDAL